MYNAKTPYLWAVQKIFEFFCDFFLLKMKLFVFLYRKRKYKPTK